MEAMIGAASGLVNKVMNLLSNDLVKAYVDSSQLGLNSQRIKIDLLHTQGLLHEARQWRVAGDNPGLQDLLLQLSAKADEAEDALDELHYFIIQDQLDSTGYAVPDLGDGLRGHARHGLHAIHHYFGNCFLSIFGSRMQDVDDDAAAVTHKLQFDRVAMSKKIKSVIEEIHSLCGPISNMLSIVSRHSSSTAIVNLERPLVGSTAAQDTLYGRRDLLEQTIKDIITSGTNSNEALSVLPIVGPGGIGKTTFTQHLYNDRRIEEHFAVRAWVCVSTDFDVVKLSQQILSSIQRSNTSNQTNNLAELQISITEELKSKRFLIVFDDIWECNSEGWKNLLAPFRKGEAKGNMVLVTTRFPSVADMVKTAHSIPLKGLEPDDFFTFFKTFIFDGKKRPCYHDDLVDLARDIAKKLKGSPLAAKTVGRLLKKELSQEHWMAVLENSEWQKQKNVDDIMPSLRISYDYLPIHLKKCFPYFSLFPEDYRFNNIEITYFWIAIGIIDKDENYMEELVDNGFLVKENWFDQQYYVIHDLFHELSRSVSSQECLNIYSSVSFRADAVPKSIRHLSITMEDRDVGTFRGEMVKLKSKVDIVNLRALMIFRKYGETVNEILIDTFKEIEGLRVLFIEFRYLESLPHNFSKLIHLRYLKISSLEYDSEVTLPSTLSRFYHLKILDLSGMDCGVELPKDFSHLINLCHFIAEEELHSNVPEVGRLKYLKELQKFHVNKESVGFELSELRDLTELGGELAIYNIKSVATKEGAMKAKLVSKGYLKGLRLVWEKTDFFDDTTELSDALDRTTELSDALDGTTELSDDLDGTTELSDDLDGTTESSDDLDGTTELSDVLDGLEPHPNLRSLVISNHGGSTGPSWLCDDINMEMLESLHLEGVSWVTLPPFEQLPHLTSLTLMSIDKVSEIRPGIGGTTDKSFLQLKEIVLDSLPELIEWVGVPNAHSFSRLETIYCRLCPNLCALPFLQECSAVSYNHLSKLYIYDCPELSIPPMPHTSTLTEVDVSDTLEGTGAMQYTVDRLHLTGYTGALACHNMASSKVKSLTLEAGSKFPWAQLPKLTSLRELIITEDPSFVSIDLLSNLTSLTNLDLCNCDNLKVDGFNPLIAAINLKELKVGNSGDGPRSVAANLLSELVLANRTKQLLPAAGCFQLEDLDVDSISAALAAPVCSLLAATLHRLQFTFDQRVESFTEEEENALQLLTSLQGLTFWECPGLPSLPRQLHRLSSLSTLKVKGCPEIRSLPNEGLPTSLRKLIVVSCAPELHEQAKELEGTNPDLSVDASWR